MYSLNGIPFKKKIRTDGQTHKRTNGQTDGRSDYIMPQILFRGIKNVCTRSLFLRMQLPMAPLIEFKMQLVTFAQIMVIAWKLTCIYQSCTNYYELYLCTIIWHHSVEYLLNITCMNHLYIQISSKSCSNHTKSCLLSIVCCQYNSTIWMQHSSQYLHYLCINSKVGYVSIFQFCIYFVHLVSEHQKIQWNLC